MTFRVDGWRHACNELEAPMKMALVGKSQLRGKFGNRNPFLQAISRFFDPQLEKPFIRRHPDEPVKRANYVGL
jgi:hypothetical protein